MIRSGLVWRLSVVLIGLGPCRPSWPPDAHATIIRLIIACSDKNRDQLNATRPCPFRRQNISRFFASTTD